MMEKVFLCVGVCPHDSRIDVDSFACRMCSYYYRNVKTFIWCSHPVDERAKEKEQSNTIAEKKTAIRKPVSTKKRAKGNAAQIKKAKSTPKQATGKRKRGRPKKNA